MSDNRTHRLLRPETLTALGIIVVAAGFLILAFQLRPISALLPAAMLIGLIGLSVVLLIADQRHASQGAEPVQVTKAPKRVFSSRKPSPAMTNNAASTARLLSAGINDMEFPREGVPGRVCPSGAMSYLCSDMSAV